MLLACDFLNLKVKFIFVFFPLFPTFPVHFSPSNDLVDSPAKIFVWWTLYNTFYTSFTPLSIDVLNFAWHFISISKSNEGALKSRLSSTSMLYNLFSSFNFLLLVPFLKRFNMRLQVLNDGFRFFLFLDSLAQFRATTILAKICSPLSKPLPTIGVIVGVAVTDGSLPLSFSPLSSKFSPWLRVCWIKDD